VPPRKSWPEHFRQFQVKRSNSRRARKSLPQQGPAAVLSRASMNRRFIVPSRETLFGGNSPSEHARHSQRLQHSEHHPDTPNHGVNPFRDPEDRYCYRTTKLEWTSSSGAKLSPLIRATEWLRGIRWREQIFLVVGSSGPRIVLTFVVSTASWGRSDAARLIVSRAATEHYLTDNKNRTPLLRKDWLKLFEPDSVKEQVTMIVRGPSDAVPGLAQADVNS
jgi:hypothetical protein